jgi:hypothetical protein
MLAPVIVGVIVAFLRVPKEHWKRVVVAKNKTLFGRIINLAEIILVIYFATILLQFHSNASNRSSGTAAKLPASAQLNVDAV